MTSPSLWTWTPFFDIVVTSLEKLYDSKETLEKPLLHILDLNQNPERSLWCFFLFYLLESVLSGSPYKCCPLDIPDHPILILALKPRNQTNIFDNLFLFVRRSMIS